MIHIPLESSRKKESKRHGCERSFTSVEWKSSFPTPLGSSQPARWRRALLLLLERVEALEAPEPKQPEWRQRPYAAYETVEQWRKEEGVSWNRRRVPLCGTAET